MNFILSKYFIRFLTIFLLIFLSLKPFNWFCNYSQRCEPIFLSELLPSFEGKKPITVIPVAKNYNKFLEFETVTKNFTSVTGRKNIITYKVKNLTQSTIRFRPKFHIEPKDYAYYLIRKNCLCFEDILLKKGEEKELSFNFKVKKDFDENYLETAEERTIIVGYSIEN
ncbi:MAG: hypothetical protein FJ368_02450 [Pelagibacterales bacterium]|nr:hypothetical protein [Pelagibacterales bacterium]